MQEFYPISEEDAPYDNYEFTEKDKEFLLNYSFKNNILLNPDSNLMQYAKEINHPICNTN